MTPTEIRELLDFYEARESALAHAAEELKALRSATAALFVERSHLTTPEDVAAAHALYMANPAAAELLLFGSTEYVCAENPYGCNQYGEGWRMPHHGRASKPGKPVKKTDKPNSPDKKDDKKKPDTPPQKPEEPEDDPFFPGDKAKEIEKVIGKEQFAKLRQQLKEAPRNIQNLWKKYISRVPFNATRGNSHHINGQVFLNPEQMKPRALSSGEVWDSDNQTLFHEFAHAIDHYAQKDAGGDGYHRLRSTKSMDAAIDADIKALRKATAKKLDAEAEAFVAKHGKDVTPELINHLREIGWITEAQKKGLERGDPHNIKYSIPRHYQRAMGIKYKGRKLALRKVDIAFEIYKEITKPGNARTQAAVCDALAGNGITLQIGHSKSYYKAHGGHADAFETFANMFSALALNQTDVLNNAKKLLPKTHEAFINVLDNM